MLRLLRPIVLLLLLAAAANAQTLSEINRLSGLDKSIDGLNASLETAIDQLPGPKPPRFVEAWKIASEDAFNTERILAAIEKNMDGALTSDQLAQLQQFFLSDLGRSITAAETASAVGKNDEIRAEGPKIFAEVASKDPERLALYKRMIDATDAYTFGEVISLNIGYGIIAGMSAAAKQPLTGEQIRELLRKSRDKRVQTIEQKINFSTAYTYRGVPVDQMRAYVEFLETPPASAYYDGMKAAIGDVLSEEARQFGDNLYKALGIRNI